MSKFIFLADDDVDDRILFEDALKEVCEKTQLVTSKDGDDLMRQLHRSKTILPDVIFLDLNMPCKNGLECLEEIKGDVTLNEIPIIIFSTSSDENTINKVFSMGANYYISKPSTFSALKKVIQLVLSINWEQNSNQSTKEKIILQF